VRKPAKLKIVAGMLLAGVSLPAMGQQQLTQPPAPPPTTPQEPALQQPVEQKAVKKVASTTSKDIRHHPGEWGYRFATSRGVRRDVKSFNEPERFAWQGGRPITGLCTLGSSGNTRIDVTPC
jgi:hypothetical protein